MFGTEKRATSEAAPASEAADEGTPVSTEMATKVSAIWEELAGVSTEVDSVVRANAVNVGAFGALREEAQTMLGSNRSIDSLAQEAETFATDVNLKASESRSSLDAALADVQRLTRSVGDIDTLFEELADALGEVTRASAEIATIADTVRMLAFNATIEATRAGSAGLGFAYVAQEVKELAVSTREATGNINGTIKQLTQITQRLSQENRSNVSLAGSVESSTGELGRVMKSFSTAVDEMRQRIGGISDSAQSNLTVCEGVTDSLNELIESVETESSRLREASGRTDNVMWETQSIVETAIRAGLPTADSLFLALAEEGAARAGAAFEAALSQGTITEAQLFDDSYRPVKGSNPAQHLTQFTEFTDEVLPAIQEELVGKSEKLLFCAAIDRNGYIPTHNRRYSKPQGADPDWNNANSRNRRFFKDATGMAAATNTERFKLTSYRRDMGGDTFVPCKDLSCPIFVNGRHWGGFRVCYVV